MSHDTFEELMGILDEETMRQIKWQADALSTLFCCLIILQNLSSEEKKRLDDEGYMIDGLIAKTIHYCNIQNSPSFQHD